MLDLWLNPVAFRALHAAALLRAFLRHGNPRRRAASKRLAEFHERMWREAAAELGASYKPLGYDFAEIELDGVRTRVTGRLTSIDDAIALELAGHKLLTHRLLEEAGIPTPRYAGFSGGTLNVAAEFLESTGAACVVKPAAGSAGGRGVSSGIRTRRQLARAAAVAAVFGDELLIEEQIAGDNYRLLYLDGELLDAFRRKPPSVVADGRSTLVRLIRRANEARLRDGPGSSQVLLTIDLELERTLAAQGLTLRSVPAAGARVTLKRVVNENCMEDNTAAADVLCAAVIDTGAAAARLVGARLAGIDVITPDPTAPLAACGGVVLEVNTTPNYIFHYRKSGGECPVARHVLRRLLESGERTDAGSLAAS